MKEKQFKKGEFEAMQILSEKGVKFDENYHDDNSKKSMPDLRYENGRYLEVTHTKHNNKDWSSPNEFAKKSLEERVRISRCANLAYERLEQDEYEKDDSGEYTSKGES